MPWIASIRAYNAALERIERLGLSGLLDELGQILTNFDLALLEQRDANGGAEVRARLDARFAQRGWIAEEHGRGDIDWIKRVVINGVTLAVGVEVQMSGRGGGSHLSDIVHLRAAIAEEGRIDIGVMVVPTDRVATYLTDRIEGYNQVQRYVEQIRADDLPLLLVALQHDRPGPALPKRAKRRAGGAEGDVSQ